MKKATINVYEIITESFIKDIESGANPFWVKPWEGITPRNFASGHVYRGLNVIWLGIMDRSRAALYASYKQVQGMGGNVVKGAKARQVAYWNFGYITGNGRYINEAQYKKLSTAEKAECKKSVSLRYSNVFNIMDCEGIDTQGLIEKYTVHTDGAEQVDACEEYINATGAVIKFGGSSACYSPATDIVRLPNRENFHGTGEYYSTAFHELGHWTGHSSRLDRELKGSYDKESYSKEELTAELTAAFLCNRFGQDTEGTQNNSSAYLQGWLQAIKGDAKLIMHASGRAQKAVDFMDGLQESKGGEDSNQAQRVA